jgi:Holliday junction resolvase
MRYRARVDANHKEIVDALRDIGASVVSLAPIGKGCPDLLVGYRGRNYLLEVKTEKGALKPLQVTFAELWRGQVVVVRSIDEAIMAVTGGTYERLYNNNLPDVNHI